MNDPLCLGSSKHIWAVQAATQRARANTVFILIFYVVVVFFNKLTKDCLAVYQCRLSYENLSDVK